MKHCVVTMVAVVLVSLFGSTGLHAQTFYTNAKQMTFARNMEIYWIVFKVDLTRYCDATPEDKFFAPPPAYGNGNGSEEQSSIGSECAHAADEMDNMCTRALTGKYPPGVDPKHIYASGLYGTEALKLRTKAAVMASLAEGVSLCNILFNNFADEDVDKMVMSQHALQPLGPSAFNVIAHTREVWGRVASYMVALNIKQPRIIGAADPDNPKDLVFCGGKESPDDSLCKTVQGKGNVPDSLKTFDPQFKPAADEPK